MNIYDIKVEDSQAVDIWGLDDIEPDVVFMRDVNFAFVIGRRIIRPGLADRYLNHAGATPIKNLGQIKLVGPRPVMIWRNGAG